MQRGSWTRIHLGLVQLETVTVDGTSANGPVVNKGVVAIQVDGQAVYILVHNGVATAAFATGLLDLSVGQALLLSHPLTVSYGDRTGAFAASGANTTLPAIWIDYLLTLLAADIGHIESVA